MHKASIQKGEASRPFPFHVLRVAVQATLDIDLLYIVLIIVFGFLLATYIAVRPTRSSAWIA